MSYRTLPIKRIIRTWARKYRYFNKYHLRNDKYNTPITWTGCCVCKNKTLGNVKRYERVIFIVICRNCTTTKEFWGGVEEFKYNYTAAYKSMPYDNLGETKYYAIYGVCSNECLNMFILAGL